MGTVSYKSRTSKIGIENIRMISSDSTNKPKTAVNQSFSRFWEDVIAVDPLCNPNQNCWIIIKSFLGML